MPSFLTDPFWYKDAVIYELHVRSFFDANNDGFGDFEGLRQRLPYLESLGVNTVWLLPFLESPLKDDGYDTADYYKVLPVHGDLDDFKAFLDEAHERGMRVVTELVLNHTSDQHPWFQEARNPQSDKHDWYVWSETTEKYEDARIIFTDTEVSNWTWDRKAQKYYWHRFFSHQPDLNYDNPAVREAMKEVMFFWLDMGVDGLRLDAVPYLYEREGTNCENLPETIDYIVELRQAIEARYGPGKVLLAEANQWPEDTLPYFADGEGVQMAFNFPIMPRMYLALRRENRRPLVEMLELTKDIPDDAQWAVFLRNHDELTLEMVTDEERDFMYHEYAADNRFRINVGIRRRLAPLLEGERRRIELMNALLLSLKGSPILYYGDEIGMGDDPFLGDRNGVRTPMQWSPDKNGGFSRAPHHRLFMPPVNRGPYSFEFVNVEDADDDPHSLLQFTRRILSVRKQHGQVFGRGDFRLLPVDNQAVLAFVRAWEGEQILVVANLSRFVQAVTLPPDDAYAGCTPVELFSQNPMPAIGDAPYTLTIGPHGFYWFALQPEEAAATSAYDDQHAEAATDGQPVQQLPTLRVAEGLQNLLVRTLVENRGMERLEAILPAFLRQQRWFGAKSEAIRAVHVADGVRIQADPAVYLVILRVELGERTERYLLPLSVAHGEAASAIVAEHRSAALTWLDTGDARALVYDATVDPAFWLTLFRWWQRGGKGRSLLGLYQTTIYDGAQHAAVDTATAFGGEQSNSSALLGDRYYMKLYRRMEAGMNPEVELLEHLTAEGFHATPALRGTLAFKQGHQLFPMGIVQDALPVEADGWTRARALTTRFLDRVDPTSPPPERLPTHYTDKLPAWLDELAPELQDLTRSLGVRTAEMHRALARAEAADLRAEPGSSDDTDALLARVREEAHQTRTMLKEHPDLPVPEGAQWDAGLARLDRLAGSEATREKIRVHGDYHLGQVVLAEGEVYILDFEGEPARPLDARRRRDYALRDVAGMLRSLEYAALSACRDRLEADEAGGSGEADGSYLEAWTLHLIQWCESVFMQAYYNTVDQEDFLLPLEAREPFLWAYLFDKALYEVRYELNNRPSWVWLPLRGLERLLDQAASTAAAPAS